MEDTCFDYDNYKKKGKKKRSLKKKLVITFVVLLSIFIALVIYFDRVVNPQIVDISRAKVNGLVVQGLNEALSLVASDESAYQNMVEIKTDNDGQIMSIQTNSFVINNLTQALVAKCQERIALMGQQGIGVPLGNFTGLAIFAGLGPKINLKIMPLGSVQAQFNSSFTTAGINQTRHQIFVDITAYVSLVLPLRSHKVTVDSSFLITESIIVGKIPNVYLTGGQ